MPSSTDTVLEVKDLKVHFPVMAGAVVRRQVGSVKAVDGVSFDVRRGETLGLVGESGCGKSTTGLAILKMIDITSGEVKFEGEDISSYDRSRMRPIRRRMQMVYQDPFGSLNPRMKVSEIVGEPLEVHGMASDRAAYDARVASLLDMVGLLPDMADRYPHEFSGGQRQRIGIARALALNPELIVGDEPVSALDVSIQAQIINLLMELQDEFKLSYLFVAHDLAVVEHISHRVAVMYLGRIVEMTDKRTLFEMPLHPYTEALLSAVPIPKSSAKGRKRVILTGDVPSPINPPPGCHFHARCPYAMPRCKTDVPALREVMPGHFAACHLHDGGVAFPLRNAGGEPAARMT
jgi:peptide/nickel transport system ATP-binding protein